MTTTGHGVFRGSGATSAVVTYETWLNRPMAYVLDFTGRSTLTTDPWKGIRSPWPATKWDPNKVNMVLSIAMLPNARYTLSAGAKGNYNDHWVACAKYLVSKGHGNAILRLGWEFNGKFYPWTAVDKATDFKAYWRQIVKSMRSVPGANFKFDWCPLAMKGTNAFVESCYPGADVVDIHGLDAYDTCPSTSLRGQARWDKQRTMPVGLEWHKAFAAKHGKPRSFPECGVTLRPNDNLGAGDNPFYIAKMFHLSTGWVFQPGVLYYGHFDYDADDASHRLSPPTKFPNASAEFRRLVGQS